MRFKDHIKSLSEIDLNSIEEVDRYLLLSSVAFDETDEKWRIIYMTVNTINGKCYIGQHSTKKLKDGYLGSGKLLLQAIKRYGKENFNFGILEYCETQEETDEREIEWIKYLDTLEPKGYNISIGGANFIPDEARKRGQETRRKRLKSGEITVWNKGLKGCYSEEHNKHLSDIKKGTKQSEESNKKRSDTLRGREYKREWVEKRVESRKKNNKKYPESFIQHLREVNTGKVQSEETIAKRVAKTTGMKRNEEQKLRMKIANNKNSKPIIQMDRNYNFIKRWNNLSEICDTYGDYKRQSLIGSLNNHHCLNNYRWEYEK